MYLKLKYSNGKKGFKIINLKRQDDVDLRKKVGLSERQWSPTGKGIRKAKLKMKVNHYFDVSFKMIN